MGRELDEPGFLDYVAFTGWDYRRPPPADVRDSRYLEGGDPWLTFCCILERAKLGDFEERRRLPALWQTDDVELRFAAQYLLASIGRQEDMRAFEADILAEDTGWRMETADHASVSGSLTFVEAFMRGYRLAFGETTRHAMEEGLANLLTPDPDSRLVVDCLLCTDRAAGEERLRTLARKQRDAYGRDVSLYRAVPVTVDALIGDIERVLAEDEPIESFAHLQSLVTRLQTMVGFSRASMFDEEAEVWDESAIRRALAASAELGFVPGVRYFFGHPAPL
jgi:hypothetical protein